MEIVLWPLKYGQGHIALTAFRGSLHLSKTGSWSPPRFVSAQG